MRTLVARRREGRARMDDACAVIVEERQVPAVLVDLSPRGARIATAIRMGEPGEHITFCFKGQFIRAEVRFTESTQTGFATGLRLLPENKAERAVLRNSLRDRLLEDRDGNREHVRLSTRWNVTISTHDAQGVVSDIAVGGIGLHTNARVQVGERMTIAFEQPLSGEVFIVSGLVKHVNDGHVGMTVDTANHDRFYDQMQACWELGDGV